VQEVEFPGQGEAGAQETGLLVSSYQTDGTTLDGPEGSTIWMVVHCLQVVDESFARDQFERARKELGRTPWDLATASSGPPRGKDRGTLIPEPLSRSSR